MAVRNDVRVDWSQSPRLIFIAAPSVTISIQDLVDTLRVLEEDLVDGLANSQIIAAAGKENLGGGVSVGITAKLLNARIAFESRKNSTESGSITTLDINGVTINDTSATFISNGVVPGSWVVNLTDGSRATILKVVSETQLITDGLGDGTDNKFEISDVYEIQNVIQCDINGGNIVAVGADGVSVLSPILPTMGTQAVKTASSSATINDQQLQTQQKYLIESLRKDHQASGEIFYWNPLTGSDSNSGELPELPRATFASIHDNLIVSGRGDVVFIVANSGGTGITISERLSISKHSVFLRAPGNTKFIPSTTTGPTITITGNNVSLSGVSVYNIGGGHPAIRANGGNFRMESSQVITSTGNGLEILGGSANFIERVLIRGCAGNGILVKDTTLTNIESSIIRDNVGYGVKYEATSLGSCAISLLDYGVCQNNTTGGVSIGDGVVSTTITDRFYIALNAEQPIRISNLGIYTDENEKNVIDRNVDAIWDELKSTHTTPGSIGNDLATSKNVIAASIVFK